MTFLGWVEEIVLLSHCKVLTVMEEDSGVSSFGKIVLSISTKMVVGSKRRLITVKCICEEYVAYARWPQK